MQILNQRGPRHGPCGLCTRVAELRAGVCADCVAEAMSANRLSPDRFRKLIEAVIAEVKADKAEDDSDASEPAYRLVG